MIIIMLNNEHTETVKNIHMDNQQQALEQLVASSRKQERYARIQCICTIAAALFCLLLLISVCRVIPQVQQLAAQISNLSSHAEF